MLLALIPFLLLYLAVLAGALGLMVWAIWPADERAASPPEAWPGRLFLTALRISVMALAVMLFAFLLKGFFKRGGAETSRYLEVAEREQPELFQFIRSLCQEIGCRVPARVYLSYDVNAAICYPTSILNLIVPPQKNLLIGLGLVNGLNLVEFKALLAHELGHFSQRTLRLDGYVWVAYQVIANIVSARDRWDNWVIRGVDMPWVSIFAVPLYGLAELTRGLLKAAFRVLNFAHLSLRRQMELNADLVAVIATGSDAPVHLLLKSDFSQACLEQSGQDLALAAEHGLLTRDLFFHQQRAGNRLRAASNNPDLGQLPDLPADPSRSVAVFQPGDTSTLAMWADHPSHYDRERNAKQSYFRSPHDDRPAWLLFRNPEAVREQVSRQFYGSCLRLDLDESLADPESVQAFIDEEHAEVTFDPRYQGIYDNRCLELANFDQLVRDAWTKAPPSPDELSSSLRELYATDLQSWVTKHRRRRDEIDVLSNLCSGRSKIDGEGFEFRGRCHPVAEAENLLREVHGELEEDGRYLASFDRSVFTLHSHLAEQLGRQEELGQRYRFHLDLQRLGQLAWDQKAQVEAILRFLQISKQLRREQVSDLEEALARVHHRVTDVFLQACHLLLPPLKHLKAGRPLASLLPQEPDLPDLRSAESYTDLDLGLLTAFHHQLAMVVDRLSWIQVKSLACILIVQEELASQWSQHAETVQQPVMQPAERQEQLK
ncbi:MAG TPA: M48 family metallopeptidase [Gemmataceae bacterium]|nr:M48 family metallopeptidase [Gemmataceae bacterium]